MAEKLDKNMVKGKYTGKSFAKLNLNLIHTLKKKVDELEESRSLFNMLFETAPDAYFLNDTDGTIINCNKVAADMVGSSRKELIGKNFMKMDYVAREDLRKVLTSYKRAMKNMSTEQEEITLVTGPKKDVRKIVEISTHCVTIKGKRFLLRVAHDITEKKKAAEKIKDSENKLRAIFASIKDLIIVLDKEGRYLEIAPTNPDLLYKTEKNLIGKRIHRVFSKKQADFFMKNILRSINTKKTVNMEYSLDIGGKNTWFSANISPMGADKIVLVARDVTEKKRGEQELKKSEENFRSLLQSIPGMVYRARSDWSTEILGGEVRQLTGYDISEFENKKVNWMDLIHPEDKKRVLKEALKIKSRSSKINQYYRIIRKDKKVVWVKDRKASVSKKGKLVRVDGVVIDITDIKSEEE